MIELVCVVVAPTLTLMHHFYTSAHHINSHCASYSTNLNYDGVVNENTLSCLKHLLLIENNFAHYTCK